MAASDRTQWKQVVIGVLGSLRTVANSFLAVAQDAQRFQGYDVAAATTATTDYNFAVARVDRPVQVKEVRILPGGALTYTAGNYVTLNVVYTNDNTGVANGTVLGTIATNNTAANGATGNWAAGTSITIPLFTATTANANLNESSNMIVPSGSQLFVTSTHTGGAGVAIPAGTRFQVLWEEV
jgi:hypothetical protein